MHNFTGICDFCFCLNILFYITNKAGIFGVFVLLVIPKHREWEWSQMFSSAMTPLKQWTATVKCPVTGSTAAANGALAKCSYDLIIYNVLLCVLGTGAPTGNWREHKGNMDIPDRKAPIGFQPSTVHEQYKYLGHPSTTSTNTIYCRWFKFVLIT